MLRIKLWLIIIAIILIFTDKLSFIGRIRDTSSVYMQKNLNILKYKLTNYPKLVLLQKSEQSRLEKENVQLKKQLEQYSLLLNQQANQGADAKALSELNQAGSYNQFNVVTARGIIDVNYLVNNRLLIDKGATSGIKQGDAVINKEGVIGQVGINNPNNSQIMLITNPEFKIYVQNSLNKSKMLAQGMGNNSLIVKYIDKSQKIQVGDILTTTGLDDVYPANIPVARVIKVFFENNGFNMAICEPVVHLNKIQYVLVLKHV